MNAATLPERLQALPQVEIDLIELISNLWKQKVVILATALLITLIGAAYAFLAPKYYSVQSILRPAAIRDLDQLNQLGLYSLPPQDALQRIGQALDSYDNRLNFFRTHAALFESMREPSRTLEQTFERFNDDAFRMLWPDAKERAGASLFVGIQLTYPDTLDGTTIVNDFVRFSIDSVRQQIASDLETLIGNRLAYLDQKIGAARASYEASKEVQIAKLTEADNLKRVQLEDELAALRQQLKTRRSNRIAQLDEAIAIAKSLNIVKPSTPSSLSERVQINQNMVRTEINNQQLPLYFMGSEALQAERGVLVRRASDDFTEPRVLQIRNELELLKHNRQVEALNSREDEDLFLADLATWREEAARLRAMNIDAAVLRLASIDQVAVEPIAPIKPKKALIVALSLILGGMLGVMIALLRTLVSRRKSAAEVPSQLSAL
jgi:LPS O-antigen subunit length determinant protein (WzzB/FepE family)